MNNNNYSRFIPLITAISLIVGLLIGSFYANHFTGNRLSIINTSSNKINDLLHIIDDQYVDKVNLSDLVEKAMPQILSELDPHSSYTSAKDVEEEMQDLKGSFPGIGVVFTIYSDTARIIRVVRGGPSDEVGLQAGDRIVTVDGKNFVGKMLTDDYAISHLKGPKGSKVRLGIRRPGVKKLLSYTVVRDNVPIKSISTAYMVDKTTGYIKIDSWGDTTYPELLVALAKLHQRGFKNLIIDLRGNRGGFMAPPIRIAKDANRRDRSTPATDEAATRQYRSLCWSTRHRHRRARSSPPPSKTMTAERSWAGAPLAKDLCKSRYNSPTVACFG